MSEDFSPPRPSQPVPPAQTNPSNAKGPRLRPGTTVALVIGLAAISAAAESDLVRDIQRYCAVCWRNAKLDPNVWEDCTQEVCCRLLSKARAGELDLDKVLDEDTAERRELVRAIDMVRKRIQRAKRHQSLDDAYFAGNNDDQQNRHRQELGEVLEAARTAVLSPKQDQIVELWTMGWSVPEISEALDMPPARVSDQKYKALRKLERRLADQPELLEV